MNTTQPRWLIYLLFLLASVHCARSIFLVNVSLLDLPKYEAGTERMPFQGRIAMMPVLRWAHTDATMARAAAFFDASLKRTPHMLHPPEDYTAEKLVCMVLGVIAVATMTFAGVWYGRRRLGDFWWVPAVVTLAMLYVTYAARYEMEFWYPYDLPHFAIFGIACLCFMEEAWFPALVLYIVDIPLRETSVYLVAVVLVLEYGRGRWRLGLGIASAMLLAWLPLHLWISVHYAHNPSDTGISPLAIKRALLNPLHWPQIASAFGYLLVPLVLGRRFLTRDMRYLLWGALPCLVVTLLFGIWYETRIWNEWIVPAAAMLGMEAMRWVESLRGEKSTGRESGARQSPA